MRKLIVLFILFVGFFALHSEERQVKIFGGVGLGSGDYKKLNLTGGVELVLAKHFSFMLEADYFNDPDNEWRKEVYQSGDVMVLRDNTMALSFGGFCKYSFAKFFFVKAGLIYSYHKTDYKDPDKNYREIIKTRKSGVSGGVGVDIPLSKKLSTRWGADLYDSGNRTWWKFYTNICFRII